MTGCAADHEFGQVERWQAFQDALLRRHIAYLGEYSPFYRRRFAEGGLTTAVGAGRADLTHYPLTTKDDLARCGAEFLCVPAEQVADICLTSGTTGEPVAMLQTVADLERLARNEAMSFRAAGIAPGDRVLIATTLDRCFMAGLAYCLGLNRLGATVIRGGSNSLPYLAELVRRQQPRAIIGVPTLLLALACRLQAAGGAGLDGVTTLIGIGEPLRRDDLTLSPLGERLRQAWGGAKILSTYASTEMATAFTDCREGCGGHLLPELMVVEILDAKGQAVPPGVVGEVVATPLQVTGMPLLRFCTGDLAALHVAPCSCGRTTPRLGPVVGRKAQMLKVRGTTLYPPAIAAALQELPAVRGHYLEVHAEFDLSDRLLVVVGSDDPQLSVAEVAEAIAVRIRVKPEVKILPVAEVLRRTVQEDQRKPVTFFDYREKQG
ncbi:MAG: CoF synthetase [Desulfuromonadales bacterium GWC2_61_20]|nr:MAG: CoF synthetase [Desulfuromonadales bacterium GWC2_61_20]HBT82665.1 CoF synthetase [Desulfuromonas sp.]